MVDSLTNEAYLAQAVCTVSQVIPESLGTWAAPRLDQTQAGQQQWGDACCLEGSVLLHNSSTHRQHLHWAECLCRALAVLASCWVDCCAGAPGRACRAGYAAGAVETLAKGLTDSLV